MNFKLIEMHIRVAPPLNVKRSPARPEAGQAFFIHRHFAAFVLLVLLFTAACAGQILFRASTAHAQNAPDASGHAASQAPSLAADKQLIQTKAERPFQGTVTREMARQAALSSLRGTALGQTEILLARQEGIRKMLSDDFADRTAAAELRALAFLALRMSASPQETISGLPPSLRLELAASFTIPHEAELNRQALHLLENPLLAENLALAAEMERQNLAEYDEAATRVIQALSHGGQATEELSRELLENYEALRGAGEYLEILPDLYLPGKISPSLLPKLEQASRLLPENYLISAELGRLYLWLEDSEKAMASLNAAIMLNPDFAQAYSHRGTLWLIRHKPSLALADFNRAIELAPERAEYFYNRAVAWRTMGNAPAMCDDLRQSCLLGHCEALEWAHAGNECR